MPKILRIYAERIDPEVLLGRAFDDFWRTFPALLASRGWSGSLELVTKVVLAAPGTAVEVGTSRLLSERAGIPVDRVWLWGQHWDPAKVFLNRSTLDEIFDGWDRTLSGLGAAAGSLEGIFFDLEPNLAHLERLRELRSFPSAFRKMLTQSMVAGTGARHLRVRLAELRATSAAPVMAACVPVGGLGGLSWILERALGTPMTEGLEPLWPELTAMVYPSFALPLLDVLGPARANLVAARLGRALTAAHLRHWRHTAVAASVICGTNCVGILEDEPSFAGPEAMAPLLRAAVELRPHALGVFNLSGIVYGPRGGAGAPLPALWRRWGEVLGDVLAEDR
jgi:hypothetical protein